MDIKLLEDNKEKIAAEVHNAWWEEKISQGFHSPTSAHSDADKFVKVCDKCHTDMYPYNDLPENIKDYDRVTVQAVIDAIAKL